MAMSTVLTEGVAANSLFELVPSGFLDGPLFAFSIVAESADFTYRFPFVNAQDVQRSRAIIGRIFGDEPANGLALILGQTSNKSCGGGVAQLNTPGASARQ
jgi:hypothetical protein